MTLASLLAVLAENTNTQVSIYDSDETTLLIKFNAAGYENIIDTVTERTVSKITMVGNRNIAIVIADAE